jgi:hypothetical protein
MSESTCPSITSSEGIVKILRPGNRQFFIHASNHASMQPRTILDSSRIDPFSTLPVPHIVIIDEFLTACLSSPFTVFGRN